MACGKTQDEIDYMYDSSVCRVCKRNSINVNIEIDLNWDKEWSFEGHICTNCYDYVLRPILEGKCSEHIQEFKDKVKLKERLSLPPTDYFSAPRPKWDHYKGSRHYKDSFKKNRFKKDDL